MLEEARASAALTADGASPIAFTHYYAAFVIDPDGHNIEAVFQGP